MDPPRCNPQVHTLSTFRNRDFHAAFGVDIADGALRGMTARAVIVLDENDKARAINKHSPKWRLLHQSLRSFPPRTSFWPSIRHDFLCLYQEKEKISFLNAS